MDNWDENLAAGWEKAMSESLSGSNITADISKKVVVTGPADPGPAAPSGARRSRHCRWAPARVRARRGLILFVAVAAGLAAALLSAQPAHASGCIMSYIFNYDGSPVWSNIPVSAQGSCGIRPAIARWPSGTMITTAGGLYSGFETWQNFDGSGNFSDYGGGFGYSWGWPAMLSGSSPQIVITLDNRLRYFTAPPEAGLQGNVELPGPPVSLAAPAIARAGTATEVAATAADYSLWFYWNIDGTPTWVPEQIAGPWRAFGAPAIAADATATEVSAEAVDGSLWFYWILNGTTTWHAEEVAGPGSLWSGPAMTHSDGGIQIAAQGPNGSLIFYWAADGTTTWHREQVAGPGTMQGVPAMVAGNYTMEIAVTATDDSLRYYWAYDGTGTWYGGQIAPPGYATSSPAMTRSNGGTEIAVAEPQP